MKTGYTEQEIDLALARLGSRFTRIISKLNDDDLAILAYVMSPHDTTPYWGRRQIEESLWRTANDNMYEAQRDDNGRYMLVHIGEDIYKGKF